MKPKHESISREASHKLTWGLVVKVTTCSAEVFSQGRRWLAKEVNDTVPQLRVVEITLIK
jgi:hypothetical protein